MNTLIVIFIFSAALSLILTPLVGKIAVKYNIVDIPTERKIHLKPIPRIGGVAICLSFFFPFITAIFYSTQPLESLFTNPQITFLCVGAATVFALGLFDDIRRLGPGIKFFFQCIAAIIAYVGGIQISSITIFESKAIELGFLSFPITILWFLLVINAINLIDGLDGLAAGITIFVAIVLLVLCITNQQIIISLGLAALGGACLGFLRYNFNPASIFMGDCGSYFLGYMIAALGILGSIKSQTTVAILIPIIALGVPLTDTIWATVRRFIMGKRLFMPDKSHFHHKLISLGLTHRNAVMILYGMTIFSGIMAILMVHTKDKRAALILLSIGLAAFFGIRKLGYFEYLAADKIFGWLKDVTDEAGITRERRSFLNLQMEIAKSADLNQLWDNVCEALDRLQFDYAEMQLDNDTCSIQLTHSQTKLTWSRNGFKDTDICRECLMKLELPLLEGRGSSFGTLWMIKDLQRDFLTHYTLRRVEHLRRTVISTLKKFV